MPTNHEALTGSEGKKSGESWEDRGVASVPPPPLSHFPEGGMRAWMTVMGGSMILFCTFGVVQSFGAYQDYYTRISLKEHTPSQVSWIGSVQVFFLFAMGLPAGKLFDEGYFHHCILGGSLIYIFSIFMLSLTKAHHYYQTFLAQGVGMGIGMGLMFLPALSVTSHYFQARRSVAMGIVIAGSSLGAVTHPIMLNNIFHSTAGFAWGVRISAFLDLGLLVAANLLMRTRLPSRKERPNSQPVNVKNIMSDVAYMLLVAGSFLVFWGLFVPFFYLQLFAALHGVRPGLTKYLISIMNAASMFGRILPNFLADKYGPFNLIIPSTFVSAGLIFGMFGTSSPVGAIAFSILYGFFSGGFISLVTPAAALFAKDISELGTRVGLLSFVIGFALLTGNPIAGALLSPPSYTWWRPFLFATVVIFAGILCLAVSRGMLAKRKGTQYV